MEIGQGVMLYVLSYTVPSRGLGRPYREAQMGLENMLGSSRTGLQRCKSQVGLQVLLVLVQVFP